MKPLHSVGDTIEKVSDNQASSHFRLVKNAVANLVRGGAAGLAAIILPPFLVHHLPRASYSVWVLILQLSAYVGLLDFGIQTAVGRFVAHTTELNQLDQRNRIVSSAVGMLIGSAAAACFGIMLAAWQLPHLFHDMPVELQNSARTALLIVGISTALSLPASALMGAFVGFERYEVPAAVAACNKLFSAFLLIFTVRYTSSLVAMAWVFGFVNFVTMILQIGLFRIAVSTVQLGIRWLSKSASKEIIDYCVSLTIWSVIMLLISGLDTVIVGVLDFRRVAPYTLAVSLLTFVMGIQNAVFSVMIPRAAILGARGDSNSLGRLLLKSSRYGMLLLLLTGLPLIIFGRQILTIWVGQVFAGETLLILQVLIVANIVRLSSLPYSLLLIGTGQQKLVTVSPIIEGISNLAVSITCGYIFGAVGVAFGTLVGAIFGVLANVIYNIPRTTAIQIARKQYLSEGLLRPLLSLAPIWAVLLPIALISKISNIVLLEITLPLLVVTSAMLWQYGLIGNERASILAQLHRHAPGII